MDEILHSPQRELPRRRQRKGSAPAGGERAERLKERFAKFMDAAGARSQVLRRQGARVYHRAWSAMAGKPKMAPLPFLAISAVIGVAAVVGTMYTPAYVVTVDGTDVGVVRDQAVFEQAEARVEDRASQILGYDYTLDHTVTYASALVKQNELTPAADLETGVARVLALRDGGMRLKDAAKAVAGETGLSKNELYAAALQAENGES